LTNPDFINVTSARPIIRELTTIFRPSCAVEREWLDA